ncbi:MAG: SRPBCC domain-containing protein [Candidatus Sericytochromatia bacterium]|nr:SRPBCC domain-containing protein [Candidatus Sericytochromatia bacterium]
MSDRETANAPIKLKVQLPLPAMAIWQMWTNPEQVVTWLAATANIEPRQGGRYELFWDEAPEHNSTLGCRITALEPYSRMAFTWRGPEHLEALMPAGSTAVELRFTGDHQSAALYLHHTGWGEGADWTEAREWQLEAWKNALGGLKALVEMAQQMAKS